MKKLPTLYAKAKTGAILQWTVWSEGDVVISEYGQVGGKLQTTRRKCLPTNEGRSNARDGKAQAEFEARALWTNRIERKYTDVQSQAGEITDIYLPMTAKDYFDQKKVKYPVDVQPKLDGVRTVSEKDPDADKVNLTSRQGKPYNIKHIEDALYKLYQEQMNLDNLNSLTVLDGEAYIHGRSCQQITSLVKRPQPESIDIRYYVYDVPIVRGNKDLPWSERRKELERLLSNLPKNSPIVQVKTVSAKEHSQVIQLQTAFMEQGYEGAMVRLPDGRYEWNYRSKNLLKVKSFKDAEFLVVDCIEGEGRFEGCAVWICQTKDKKIFKCVSKVPQEEKKRMYAARKKYIGRYLTVKYFELTDDGIPRFPVGIVFRADEDLP